MSEGPNIVVEPIRPDFPNVFGRADLGRVALVRESNVSGETLLAALKEAECGQIRLTGKLNLNGAAETTDILANLLKTRISSKERI